MILEEPKSKMTYRYLGNSGIKVSILSFGTMLTNYYEEDKKAWLECANAAYEGGVNYFDSAEIYGMGDGDRLLGQAIKQFEWKRESLVISVKLMYDGTGPNRSGLSRKHIIEGCKDSLKRMDLDYCDLVFAHRPFAYCPLEETCRAFSWLIDKGYAKYWCTSTWPAEMIVEAIEICDELGLHKPVADQCQYNALSRTDMEQYFPRIFEEYGYGSTVWSPLHMGLLTGKYNNLEIPEDSRFGKSEPFKNFIWDENLTEEDKEKKKKMLAELKATADDIGCTQAELCLAWVIVNKDVSTCIFGASKLSQVESNLKSLEVAEKWTPEIEERINKALDNEPSLGIDYLTFKPFPSRRKERIDYNFKKGGISK